MRTSVTWVLFAALTTSAGCLSERSFQMRPEQSRPVPCVIDDATGSTRAWLQCAHRALADLLPTRAAPALLTEDMTDDTGKPIDVFKHFKLPRWKLQRIIGNWDGVTCTAQTASRNSFIEEQAPPWPGFEDTWIPVGDNLSLSARIGFARNGDEIADADAIVVLPGLFGDHGVLRSRDLAFFLRDSGFHVVSLEIRGHGQTEHEHPEACHTFGVIETDELILVSDWLTHQPHVRRTGLVGFCWSANIALLEAWYDSRAPGDPSIPPSIAKLLRTRPEARPRFEAGVIAFSPILRWEELVDITDTPRDPLWEPIYVAIQDTARLRATQRNYESRNGSLRTLIEDDASGCTEDFDGTVEDGFDFLRLMPYRDKPWYDKLDAARIPVLVVHGCNDPLAPSQDVADFLTTVSNPKVAGLILPDGGHVGFAAYAKAYYFDLVASFFRASDRQDNPIADPVAAR